MFEFTMFVIAQSILNLIGDFGTELVLVAFVRNLLPAVSPLATMEDLHQALPCPEEGRLPKRHPSIEGLIAALLAGGWDVTVQAPFVLRCEGPIGVLRIYQKVAGDDQYFWKWNVTFHQGNEAGRWKLASSIAKAKTLAYHQGELAGRLAVSSPPELGMSLEGWMKPGEGPVEPSRIKSWKTSPIVAMGSLGHDLVGRAQFWARTESGSLYLATVFAK